jgi:uroporphyrinogen decarboxylase
MTSKELVLAAIECKKVERIPWVPFCGVHTGSLIGVTATEYLKSSEKMIAGLERAIELYRPDGLPIAFDLQIEAEILGCDLNWSDDNPPAVTSHPLTAGTLTLEDLSVPLASDGRIPLILEVTETLRREHPELALYGLITGPFTLALHLLGADIFMQMFDDPEYVNRVMTFCSDVACEMSRFYIEKGCDVIALVDPMTSQIGPTQFEEFCTPHCRRIFDYIRSLDAKGSFFVCGHAQNNIEVMCDCYCDTISIDENIPLDYVRDICTKKGISFGGNLRLTTALLLGNEDDCRIDAIECLQIGGNTGFLLAPGCDIAYATPPANLQAVADLVHDKDQQEIARELALVKTIEDVEPEKIDYSQFPQVKIEVITLDSEGCAPCQYMMEAVREAVAEFGNKVDCREFKIKTPEGISKMQALGLKNIPTTCIDGDVAFISFIPTKEKLVEKISEYIKAKQ